MLFFSTFVLTCDPGKTLKIFRLRIYVYVYIHPRYRLEIKDLTQLLIETPFSVVIPSLPPKFEK